MDTNTDKVRCRYRYGIHDLVADFSPQVVHDDYPTWDRLTFSRTSRQIFAETAPSYFSNKLLPLRNAHGCFFGGTNDWQETMAKLTPSQKRYIKKVVLSWQQMREMFRAQVNPLLLTLPHLRALEVMPREDYRFLFEHIYDVDEGDWDEKIWDLVFSTNISARFLPKDKPNEALVLY